MTDILIRDVPDDALAAIDANAKRTGVTRAAYLRRILERERARRAGPVTVDHLERVRNLAADLDNCNVVSDARS